MNPIVSCLFLRANIASSAAIAAYIVAVSTLFQAAAPLVAAETSPKRVGECVKTTIAELGSRLDGSPDSGSALLYSNGVSGVSYEVVPAIRRSRIGDPVTLCLASIPKGCPKGDDRGKVYSATNSRTQGTWSLSDSQHTCGGA
jgi:hypothetical protein